MSGSHRKDSREVLIEVAKALSGASDVEGLLDQIVERSRSVMHCEVCSILLPEGDGEFLNIRSTRQVDSMSVRVPIEDSIAGDVFTTGRVACTANAQSDERHFKGVDKKTGLVSHAMLTIPLVNGDDCIGVLQAINPEGRREFDANDEELFEIFGSLVAVTLIRIQAHESAVRDAAVRREFTLAQEIQETFLPPEKLEIGTLTVEAFYKPAQNVGGDFYFCEALSCGTVLMGIGDVTGKGIPAALDMARSTTMIAAMSSDCPEQGLGQWVTRFNAELSRLMSRGRFIAGTFLLFDPERRCVSALTSGQFAPRVLRRDTGSWLDLDCPPHPPLGIAPGLEFTAKKYPLGLASAWLLYSDGMLETQNADGDYFGEGPMDSHLAFAAQYPDEIMDILKEAWTQFNRDSVYQDDVTVLLAQEHSDAPDSLFDVDCDPETMRAARAFVESWAMFAGCGESVAGLVVLGFDEIMTNIYKHAYGGNCGRVQVRAAIEPDALSITVQHWGEAFVPEPAQIGLENAGVHGGRGLYVIDQVFDGTVYHCSKDGGGTVMLRKVLDFGD